MSPRTTQHAPDTVARRLKVEIYVLEEQPSFLKGLAGRLVA
jgi:hypothetical protein